MDLEKYHLAQKPTIKTKTIPGEKAEQLLAKQDLYESNNRSYPRKYPLVPKKAKGAIIEDVDGNQFMDFFSLCGVLNVGHNHTEVVEDAKDQMDNLIHAVDFPTEVKIKLMENLNKNLPDGLKDKVKINFCGPTGADAVEAAIKLARIHTKRNLIISFQGAYHGMTMGALSVTSNLKNREDLHMINQGTHFAPYSYCYRCPFGKRPDSCNLECASSLRDKLENPHSGIDKPAAIILEPIQGEGGVIVPKKEFHREIQKICNDHEIVLIHDEIQAGFYRTGKLLSSQCFGATPDIVTMSKGIGGIGMPLAVLLIKKEMDSWGAGTHAGTFRGNQVSMAAGNSALNFIVNNNIESHVEAMGKLLMDGLETIRNKSKYIGEVRGVGLIIGVEYVKDLDTTEPFPDFCNKLRTRLFENGVLIEVGGWYNNVIRVLPPLVITAKMVLTFLEIFEKVNKEIENEYSKKTSVAVSME
jgi:diaminobutyrate-2-oxoglutarate transaminase